MTTTLIPQSATAEPLVWEHDAAADTKYQTVHKAVDRVTGVTFQVVEYGTQGVVLYVTAQREDLGTVIMDHGSFSTYDDALVAATMLALAQQAIASALRPIQSSAPEPARLAPTAIAGNHHHTPSHFGFTNARVYDK